MPLLIPLLLVTSATCPYYAPIYASPRTPPTAATARAQPQAHGRETGKRLRYITSGTEPSATAAKQAQARPGAVGALSARYKRTGMT
jgi:hypothetical protein